MSALATEDISAVETGPMSAAETGQMSAVAVSYTHLTLPTTPYV